MPAPKARRLQILRIMNVRRSEHAVILALELGVSTITIYNDVKVLSIELEGAIYAEPGRYGGIKVEDGVDLLKKCFEKAFLMLDQLTLLINMNARLNELGEMSADDNIIFESIIRNFKNPDHKIKGV